MAYLLDTDLVSDHLGADSDAVRLVGRLSSRGLAMSVVSYMEAYQGIDRGVDPPQTASDLAGLVENVPILSFRSEEARRCAGIRERLRQQGPRIQSRALDLMIAATAIELGLMLITRNVRDYQVLPDLQLYRDL